MMGGAEKGFLEALPGSNTLATTWEAGVTWHLSGRTPTPPANRQAVSIHIQRLGFMLRESQRNKCQTHPLFLKGRRLNTVTNILKLVNPASNKGFAFGVLFPRT